MRLAPPTPKTRPKRRKRYTVPPRLWVTLFVSSVAVHLLLIAAVRSRLGNISSMGSLAPIEIELIAEDELAPESQPARSTTQSASSPPISQSAPSPPPVAPATAEPESQPDTRIQPDNTIATQPAPPEEPAPAPTPSSPAPTEPDPPPSPSPVEPTPPSEPPTRSGEPTTSPNPLPNPGSPPGSSMPPGDPLDGASDDGLGTVEVDRNPTPATFSFQITTAPSQRDKPDILAEIQGGNAGSLTSDPSSCLLPTDVEVAFYGQPVGLRVEVDAGGNLLGEPEVVETSGRDGYDQLAICVVKTRTFTPGKDVKDGKEEPRASDLVLRVVIQN